MSRQIDADLPNLIFKRRNAMVCAADVASDVASRVRDFMSMNPTGSIVIDADTQPEIDPTCAKQKQRANEIYEAIGSQGTMPFSEKDAVWLARFNAALYYSNEGLS